jgi:hypothetical protein
MDELEAYIDKELKKGFPKEDIKEQLIKTGYEEQKIDELFAKLPPAVADRFRPSAFLDKRYIIFSIAGIVIIITGILLLGNQEQEEICFMLSERQKGLCGAYAGGMGCGDSVCDYLIFAGTVNDLDCESLYGQKMAFCYALKSMDCQTVTDETMLLVCMVLTGETDCTTATGFTHDLCMTKICDKACR